MTYEYNEQNLLVKETDALGVWKSYAYDGNQVVTVTHSNGLVENYSYDAMGNIVNESDSNGRTTAYVYDNLVVILLLDIWMKQNQLLRSPFQHLLN